MHTETKAMICTAAVLIAMGIFKDNDKCLRKEHKDAYRNKSNDLHSSSADRNGNI
nr:MAG TPA: hypothetical protein [Caudoviricetes sp.]